jgi:hypothetical protein
MKRILFSTLLTAICAGVFGIAHAQAAICPRLEFAELNLLQKEKLLKIRCEYTKSMVELILVGNLSSADLCISEANRMDRIIARKYALKGDEDSVLKQITDLCHKG